MSYENVMQGSDTTETRYVRSRAEHLFGVFFLLSVIVAISLVVYSTVTWMWDEQRLPLSKIVLQGDREYVTKQDVQRQFAHLEHIGTFMSQDVSALQQSAEALPWVAHASIRKQWPDTIKVYLVEHQPVAIWNGHELLDEQGVVFEGDIGLLEQDVVKLYGPQTTGAEVLAIYRELQPLFDEFNLVITSLVLNERRAWQIILDNGIRLELGKESLQERINRFFSLYQQLDSDVERISYVDLRYDTGAAVGWFAEQNIEQERKNDQGH